MPEGKGPLGSSSSAGASDTQRGEWLVHGCTGSYRLSPDETLMSWTSFRTPQICPSLIQSVNVSGEQISARALPPVPV